MLIDWTGEFDCWYDRLVECVFYNSVGSRADAAIESYLFRIRSEGATDE